MKSPFVLVAALVSLTVAARTNAQSHPDVPLVFSNGEEGSCHGFTTKDTCMKNHCAWCICAAVPSSCYSLEEADQLPPAIFQCDKGNSPVVGPDDGPVDIGGAHQPQCSATETNDVVYGEVPVQKDWRADGAVSPVKNQGKCGSCWTFSTTGCLESHVKLKHGEFTILSEQNLLDCAQNFDNHGCNGGLPSHAFEYVKYNGGLDTEETYPYEAKEGKCKFNTYHVGAQVDQVVNITARNENELKAAVGSTGPVSIAFQVVSDFRFYKSGVYESKECHSGEKDVNHAVLAVGYGVEDGKNHWIVKNSWGTKWGMDGFFQIARGSNMCGVADCASYPVVV
ncbi:Cysteine peptidase, asparagine active site [Phytophthora cactorum]|nr:Cysteine peptidase, asparagine active site [Phytophthora cactorum]